MVHPNSHFPLFLKSDIIFHFFLPTDMMILSSFFPPFSEMGLDDSLSCNDQTPFPSFLRSDISPISSDIGHSYPGDDFWWETPDLKKK